MPFLADAVPSFIECVTIAREKDKAGQRGADELGRRLEARGIEVIMLRLAHDEGGRLQRCPSQKIPTRSCGWSIKPFCGGAMNGSAEMRKTIRHHPNRGGKTNCPKGLFPTLRIRPVAPVELVKGILPRKGTSLLIGQSSAGKSFVGIDLSLSVATGTQFFGRQVKRRGGVVYIALEGGDGFGNRVMAAAEHRGIEEEIPFKYSTAQTRLEQ